jgi:hypothetical protein
VLDDGSEGTAKTQQAIAGYVDRRAASLSEHGEGWSICSSLLPSSPQVWRVDARSQGGERVTPIFAGGQVFSP